MQALAVYAVVHPAVMVYFAEFWRGLEAQLENGFRVYLSLDGVSEAQVLDVVGARADVSLLPVVHGASPATIRRHALEHITGLHPGVVLLDSDDVPLPGRLSCARDGLARHDVYGCALQIIDASGSPVTGAVLTADGQLEGPQLGTSLARTNVFGFSNTAYRSGILAKCVAVDPATVIMDWLVVCRALLSGASLVFDPVPRMLYRQYGSNTASVLSPFSPERIMTDAERVVNHFQHLFESQRADQPDFSAFQEARRLAASFLAWLKQDVAARAGAESENQSNLENYCAKVNSLPHKTYRWWEHVAALPEYSPDGSGQTRIVGWKPA